MRGRAEARQGSDVGYSTRLGTRTSTVNRTNYGNIQTKSHNSINVLSNNSDVDAKQLTNHKTPFISETNSFINRNEGDNDITLKEKTNRNKRYANSLLGTGQQEVHVSYLPVNEFVFENNVPNDVQIELNEHVMNDNDDKKINEFKVKQTNPRNLVLFEEPLTTEIQIILPSYATHQNSYFDTTDRHVLNKKEYTDQTTTFPILHSEIDENEWVRIAGSLRNSFIEFKRKLTREGIVTEDFSEDIYGKKVRTDKDFKLATDSDAYSHSGVDVTARPAITVTVRPDRNVTQRPTTSVTESYATNITSRNFPQSQNPGITRKISQGSKPLHTRSGAKPRPRVSVGHVTYASCQMYVESEKPDLGTKECIYGNVFDLQRAEWTVTSEVRVVGYAV